ncbi:tyrosine-type recombinase/integrase [Ignatzschineria rhizosphaerae]|uniref:Tyrosine-type recombinase/integrase n=1 Tax=Ignatzschineria rhizosphaerae TaxID=2923279 RepID=A0ABY3X080_9GAMM|nr:tyrosine-type recombinase/integrase [Ignatzschineria rhizosphaerae]UNM96281.1 tyrosine-type recombinase/integrase [Ignatzschineria rhizosphaerae]
MKLNFSKIKAIKPQEKLTKHSDGGGLALWVYPTGKMRWALAYREDGKQKTAYLGDYPAYSLAEARSWRDEIKNRLARSLPAIDSTLKDEAYLYKNVFEEWYARWAGEKKSQKYSQQVKNAIYANVMDDLGKMDVREIRPFTIVQALRGMEERGVLEYLRRVKSSLKMSFDYAVSCGLIDFNPVVAVGTQSFKKAEKKHFDALNPEELPLLIEKLENREISGVTRLAIYWQFLTMTRPIEAVSARWEDINLEKKHWEIPAEVMKKSRPHIIPLNDFLISLLPEIKSMNTRDTYLFEGMDYGTHLNRETPRITLRRSGLNSTAHGLRALAATILEEAGYPEAVIKAGLSHAKGGGDQTTPAYLRSTFYDERVGMMDYLGGVVERARKDFLD